MTIQAIHSFFPRGPSASTPQVVATSLHQWTPGHWFFSFQFSTHWAPLSSQLQSHASQSGTAPCWMPSLTGNSGKLPECHPTRCRCGISPGISQFLFLLAFLSSHSSLLKKVELDDDVDNVATRVRGCSPFQGYGAKADSLHHHNHMVIAPNPIVSSATTI